MNKQKFKNACNKIINIEREKNTIGRLSEKTLHAVLKYYFELDESLHEVKVGRYFADIQNKHGIFEIQTRAFNNLRKKLEYFLAISPVTIIYPVAKIKWLSWINIETAEITKRRKSPKQGSIYDVFYELYKIKPFLSNPNLRIYILLVELDEYRYLNGWSKDKKKGSERCDRIPLDIIEEVYFNNINDYSKFLPEKLPESFTAKDYKKAAGINTRYAGNAVNILNSLNIIKHTGKQGKAYIYERTI